MKKVLLCLLISILLVVSINISTNNQKGRKLLKTKESIITMQSKEEAKFKIDGYSS